MKDYIVSIDVVASLSVTDSDVAELLGLEKSALVCRQLEERALWKYEPRSDEDMTLVDRIAFITAQIRAEHPIQLDDRIKAIYLTVGIFCDAVTCTISFPAQCLEQLAKKIPQVNVEITYYPVKEERSSR